MSMKIPEPTTGMLVGGVGSTTLLDSSCESVDLKGMDISTFEEQRGVANYEHRDSPNDVVGVIVYAKKIFERSDCETPHQEECWDIVTNETPYLYLIVRLYDGAGHSEAKNLAAQIRDHVQNKDPIIIGMSIEGSTLKREDNKIIECVARQIALTLKPCNKACKIGMLADPNAPEGFKKSEFQNDPLVESLRKAESMEALKGLIATTATITAMANLSKAIEAGSCDAAPGGLSGGAALQREDVGGTTKSLGNQLKAAIRDYGPIKDKSKFKAFAKARLPDVSDEFLDHFADAAEDFHIKKAEVEHNHIVAATLKNNWENVYVELKKAVTEVHKGAYIEHPDVQTVTAVLGGSPRQVGRIMMHNGKLHHLEDYHDILGKLLPEGPLDEQKTKDLEAISVPILSIEDHKFMDTPGSEPDAQKVTLNPSAPKRDSVFEYHRAGMLRPHTVEFGVHGASLDGKALSPAELDLIHSNVRRGAATLKYKAAPGDLKKSDEDSMDPDDALQHVRAAVAAGHIHPDVAEALTRHIHHDSMVPGIGNKYAWSKFREKQKPGVYVAMDGNSFREINNNHGHDAGDSAIKAMGGALKAAGEKTGNVKVFRSGGDEFILHAPTHEHALQFLHHANEHLNSLPPVNGVHKMSMAFGLGHNPEMSDKALYHAKDQKMDLLSGKSMYHPQKTPNLAHSLVSGNEGPIHLGGHSTPKPPTTETQATA